MHLFQHLAVPTNRVPPIPRLPRTVNPLLCDLPIYELTLMKPLGIMFEEGDDGVASLVVKSVLSGGSAETDGSIWPGDVVLSLNGSDVSSLEFDRAMKLLVRAPTACLLRLGRTRGKVAALRRPDGRLAFATPGDSLMRLANRCGIYVDYDCYEGQ